MADAIWDRIVERTWDLYAKDKRICSVCVRIGAHLYARAFLEAQLGQAELNDNERQTLAASLAVVAATPLPNHDHPGRTNDQ